MGFPHSSVGKKSTCNAGDPGSIPGSGRPPGEGNGNPLEYSCLENLMDRGAWWATVHGVERVGYDLVTKLLPMKVKDKGIPLELPGHSPGIEKQGTSVLAHWGHSFKAQGRSSLEASLGYLGSFLSGRGETVLSFHRQF